jgi:hypothetical protein
MATLTELKQEVFDYVANRLGDGIVDTELDPKHYETAYSKALLTYRSRAQNAHEESYSLLQLTKNQNVYTLPSEVQSVRQIFRRTMGDATGPYSSSFDPFSSATLNVYLLNYSYAGGLATFDMYSQYVELAMRMFGGHLNFNYEPVSKKLTIMRDPKGSGEDVLLWHYNYKPEVVLLQDAPILQWIRDYTYAGGKMIIGEAREKFATIAGPQGGTPLNGSAIKAEAQAEMDRLIADLSTFTDHSQPLSWVIG